MIRCASGLKTDTPAGTSAAKLTPGRTTRPNCRLLRLQALITETRVRKNCDRSRDHDDPPGRARPRQFHLPQTRMDRYRSAEVYSGKMGRSAACRPLSPAINLLIGSEVRSHPHHQALPRPTAGTASNHAAGRGLCSAGQRILFPSCTPADPGMLTAFQLAETETVKTAYDHQSVASLPRYGHVPAIMLIGAGAGNAGLAPAATTRWTTQCALDASHRPHRTTSPNTRATTLPKYLLFWRESLAVRNGSTPATPCDGEIVPAPAGLRGTIWGRDGSTITEAVEHSQGPDAKGYDLPPIGFPSGLTLVFPARLLGRSVSSPRSNRVSRFWPAEALAAPAGLRGCRTAHPSRLGEDLTWAGEAADIVPRTRNGQNSEEDRLRRRAQNGSRVLKPGLWLGVHKRALRRLSGMTSDSGRMRGDTTRTRTRDRARLAAKQPDGRSLPQPRSAQSSAVKRPRCGKARGRPGTVKDGSRRQLSLPPYRKETQAQTGGTSGRSAAVPQTRQDHPAPQPAGPHLSRQEPGRRTGIRDSTRRAAHTAHPGTVRRPRHAGSPPRTAPRCSLTSGRRARVRPSTGPHT